MAKRTRGNGDGSIFKRGKRYWISYYDESGERKTRSSGTTDRRAAERILQAETDRVTKIRSGLIDPVAERLVQQGRRSITELIDLFGTKLRAEGRTEQYVKRTEREIREFAEAMKIESLNAITAEHAAAYLESLRAKKQSNRTRQCRITSVKGFTRWAWREGMLPADPLAGVKRPNPETDRRHRRKILLVDEWHRLDAATRTAPKRNGMIGEERSLLYAVALQTGLRAGELATLNRSSLHLTESPGFIVVEAGGTKNRKPARQYVRDELADRLRRHAALLSPGAPVFRMSQTWGLAAMLREDLALARDCWIEQAADDPDEAARRRESDFLVAKDAEGRVLDFHALRHTCGAWAAMGGASPKAIQTLMRHSTITLTLDTYGHLLPDEAAETVAKLPGFDAIARTREAATGTTDADAGCSSNVCSSRTEQGDGLRDNATESAETDGVGVLATIGGSTGCGDDEQPGATACENGPARIRTGDRAIMSRLLREGGEIDKACRDNGLGDLATDPEIRRAAECAARAAIEALQPTPDEAQAPARFG